MNKERLAAFSDGVIAIIITIMVLEFRPPHAIDMGALESLIPDFLSYILSFLYIAIYWNNHHHMLHVVQRVNGSILWANMHLLFWISLLPGWVKIIWPPCPRWFTELSYFCPQSLIIFCRKSLSSLKAKILYLPKLSATTLKAKPHRLAICWLFFWLFCIHG